MSIAFISIPPVIRLFTVSGVFNLAMNQSDDIRFKYLSYILLKQDKHLTKLSVCV